MLQVTPVESVTCLLNIYYAGSGANAFKLDKRTRIAYRGDDISTSRLVGRQDAMLKVM